MFFVSRLRELLTDDDTIVIAGLRGLGSGVAFTTVTAFKRPIPDDIVQLWITKYE